MYEPAAKAIGGEIAVHTHRVERTERDTIITKALIELDLARGHEVDTEGAAARVKGVVGPAIHTGTAPPPTFTRGATRTDNPARASSRGCGLAGTSTSATPSSAATTVVATGVECGNSWNPTT